MTRVDIASSSAAMNCILVASVYVGDLPEELVGQVQHGMRLLINNQTYIGLGEEAGEQGAAKITRNEQTKIVSFVLRRELPMKLVSDGRWVPFDILDLKLEIKLETVRAEFLGKKALVRFNLMYSYSLSKTMDYDRLLYLKGTDDFDEYGLAETRRSFRIISSNYPK